MKAISPVALAFAALLGLSPAISFAQEDGQIRLQCTGTFTRLRGANEPNSFQTNSTFVIDFSERTIIDVSDSRREVDVNIDANSIGFQNPSGASEHMSRDDGSWAVAGDDGYIKGFCKRVTDANAF